MSDTLQRRANDERSVEAIKLAANGNLAAEAYLMTIAQAARMIDDLKDKDAGRVDEGRLAHLVLVVLPRNPFFLTHSSFLIALHDMAINAWQDANIMAGSADLPIEVWADLINEIACVVSGITGGYDYRRQHSPQIRRLLYDRQAVPLAHNCRG